MSLTVLQAAQIPELLQDAALVDVQWRPEIKQLSLYFQCLRRNIDGTDIENSEVELRLCNVTGIAAYYNPLHYSKRPSQCTVEDQDLYAQLLDWNYEPYEALLSINSRQALFDMETSWKNEWLYGEAVCDKPNARFQLFVDRVSTPNKEMGYGLHFSGNELCVFSNGVPLDIAVWNKQFEAWWKGWRNHWKGDNAGYNHAQEDAFIPAGTDPPPNLSYKPPAIPVFQIENTEAPQEILEPICNYHEGILNRNWEQVAKAWTNFDLSIEKWAEKLRGSFQGMNFGRWVYVRTIEDWWIEGSQACVFAKGIEHQMPDEEDPARNLDIIVKYGLRLSNTGWVIHTLSQSYY